MATTGAKVPTAASTTSETGWAGNTWLTPENLYGAGDAAITAATFDAGVHSRVLRAYGFDFSAIPSNATITGVKVYINGAYYATAICALGLAQLLNTSGARVGTDQYASPTNLTTSPANYTKGGDGDNWGNALTPTWVKNANFGVGIGIIVGASNNCDVFIDAITMEVFYTAPETHAGSGTMSGVVTATASGTKMGKGAGTTSLVDGLVASGKKATSASGTMSTVVTMMATGATGSEEHSGAGTLSEALSMAATGKKIASDLGTDSNIVQMQASGIAMFKGSGLISLISRLVASGKKSGLGLGLNSLKLRMTASGTGGTSPPVTGGSLPSFPTIPSIGRYRWH